MNVRPINYNDAHGVSLPFEVSPLKRVGRCYVDTAETTQRLSLSSPVVLTHVTTFVQCVAKARILDMQFAQYASFNMIEKLMARGCPSMRSCLNSNIAGSKGLVRSPSTACRAEREITSKQTKDG